MIHISFDIDMPASCEKCPFLIHCDECEGWENFCALLHKKNGYDYRSFADYELTPTDRRREDCPLKDGDGRPRAKWLPYHFENVALFFECSACERRDIIKSHFCPNCGAVMTED